MQKKVINAIKKVIYLSLGKKLNGLWFAENPRNWKKKSANLFKTRLKKFEKSNEWKWPKKREIEKKSAIFLK